MIFIRGRVKKKKGFKLYCFSPEVMVATFIIEFALAIYTFIKSRKANAGTGIVVGLVLLGTFQLSEYMICRGASPLFWSRLGLFGITFLPVFGYYLVSRIKNDLQFLNLGFVTAIALAFFFVYYPQSITNATCGGNYVIFDIQPTLFYFFGYYYFGFLLLGIWKAYRGMQEVPKKKLTKEAFFWLIVGYLSFMLPMTIVYIFIAGARNGVTSIMCGFAIIFAFILTFKIAPIYHECVKTRKYREKVNSKK